LFRQFKIPLFDLVMSLSGAIDLVSKELVDHHKQVAYIALRLAEKMVVPVDIQRDIGLAGMLHDIGALSHEERLNSFRFEIDDSDRHAVTGHLLLSEIDPLAGTNIATLVERHHLAWNETSSKREDEPISLACHILHLSDRVAVLIDKEQYILSQPETIIKKIEENAAKQFSPELVDAFRSLAEEEYFWLDIVSPSIGRTLKRRLSLNELNLDLEGLLGISDVFRRIIDFRSAFTASHSSGVAASAESLAMLYGFSPKECLMMRIAGHLHDLGKLAVPVEILEKRGRLEKWEFDVIRSHSYYTYRILEPLEALSQVTEWAAFHHERLKGDGYPFHLTRDELPLGSRIMAVADVFTALTEDRPYRPSMSNDKALSILDEMVKSGALDGDVVGMLRRNFDDVRYLRTRAEQASNSEYRRFTIVSSPPSPCW
jgi:HD-GYP domain-containing protein (c-di-GMP phosphodiesterase class II)